MTITFDDLVAPVTDLGVDFDEAISSWSWLIQADSRPLLISALGDVFLDMPLAIHFLNTFEGTLRPVAESRDAWKREMQNPQRVGEWFLPGFIEALRESGQMLKQGEVYSPTVPLVLGGTLSLENFTASHWRMHLHVLGQIHEQVRHLPPGTRINKIKIEPL